MTGKHEASVKEAGLLGLSADELTKALRTRMERGFMYNLRWVLGTKVEDGTSVPWPANDALLFNVRIEFVAADGTLRLYTLGLKYTPASHDGEVVTFTP